MVFVEFFAGTRVMSDTFAEKGHEVLTIDWDKTLDRIDMYTDIGKLTAQEIIDKVGHPDVIWASPDCTTFSIAAISKHRRKDPETGFLHPVSDYAKQCDVIDQHVLELIKELNPRLFFIENPRGGAEKDGVDAIASTLHNLLLQVWRYQNETN